MNVLILSSSREDIDPYYKSIAKSIADYLAKQGCNLVFGGSSSSMMGICYDSFIKKNRSVYAFTTEKYADDLENLKESRNIICEDTLSMKKRMLENSDMIVCLPGGPGTLSEILCYIEEKRSNDKDIPLIIYNECGYYKKLGEILEEFIANKFVDESIYNTFDIANNQEEFKSYFIEAQYKFDSSKRYIWKQK